MPEYDKETLSTLEGMEMNEFKSLSMQQRQSVNMSLPTIEQFFKQLKSLKIQISKETDIKIGVMNSEIQNSLKLIFNKLKSFGIRMEKLQKTTDDYKEAVETQEYNFVKQVQQLIGQNKNIDLAVKEQVDRFAQVQQDIESSYAKFIKHITTEYVDFFKSRKNIKVDFENLSEKYKLQLATIGEQNRVNEKQLEIMHQAIDAVQ